MAIRRNQPLSSPKVGGAEVAAVLGAGRLGLGHRINQIVPTGVGQVQQPKPVLAEIVLRWQKTKGTTES